jgi:hypothetical protein
MILHIFNPEHDLALAANLSNFTAPRAARLLRQQLGWLPALWAEEDDLILVDDVRTAQDAYGQLGGERKFVDKTELSRLDVTEVRPWGWDLALRRFLLRHGVEAVPEEKVIAGIRELSHRKYAVSLLDSLQCLGTVGFSIEADSLDEVVEWLHQYGRIVVKAPWSSSGRGVRFVDGSMNESQQRWIRNVIERQGSVVVNPFYQKVKDFGMEFESDGEGQVRYLGLSIFVTQNGAYKGNILMQERSKENYINRYVSVDLLRDIQEMICSELGHLYKNRYKGPFGIDMMIVSKPDEEGLFLHPCVEINLRQTMGHVALSLEKLLQIGVEPQLFANGRLWPVTW